MIEDESISDFNTILRETANKVMTFTRKYESEEDSSDEYMTEKELVATLRILYTKWEEACSIVEK